MVIALFNLVTAVSLLLCAASCIVWLWAQQQPGGTCRVFSRYVTRTGARYTLRLEGERFVVYRPPPLIPATLQQGAARTQLYEGLWSHLQGKPANWLPVPTALPAALAAEMRNEDVVWETWRDRAVWSSRPRPKFQLYFSPRGRPGSATSQLAPRGPAVEEQFEDKFPSQEFPRWRLPPYTLPQVARPLLAAMEDESRWIAAHVVLDWVAQPKPARASPERFGRNGPSPGHVLQPVSSGTTKPAASWFGLFGGAKPQPDRFTASIDGLSVALRAYGEESDVAKTIGIAPPDPRASEHMIHMIDDGWVRNCEATIEPVQRAALLEQWHRRLDVPVAAVAAWHVSAVALILPALWTVRAVYISAHRRWRVRRILCPNCGYDLRATPGRCPECGAVSNAPPATAA